MSDTNSTPIVVAGYEFHPESLAPAVTRALLGRAIGHILGNEVAAKVVNEIRAEVAKAKGLKPDAVTREMIGAFRDEHEDEVNAMTKAARDAAAARILDGTLSVRAPAVESADAVENETRRVAWTHVQALLGKIKFPKATEQEPDPTVVIGGAHFTKGDLIDRLLAKPDKAEAFRAEAERIVEARRARAKAAAEARKAAPASADPATVSVDDLGF